MVLQGECDHLLMKDAGELSLGTPKKRTFDSKPSAALRSAFCLILRLSRSLGQELRTKVTTVSAADALVCLAFMKGTTVCCKAL